MWFIQDIKQYVTYNTRVWPVVSKSPVTLRETYKNERFQFCVKNNYNNYIIDLLIEKDIIKEPAMIRSLRSLKRKANWWLLAPGLFYNGYWSIFYNKWYDYPLVLSELELKQNAISDLLLIAVISWELPRLLDMNKDLLTEILSECSFSEIPSTIE